MKPKKPVVRTAVSGVFIAILLVLTIVVNIMLPTYNQVVSSYLGDTAEPTLTYPDSYNDSLNLQYSKMDYTPDELAKEEQRFNEEVVGEGVVLLKNDGSLPYQDSDCRYRSGCYPHAGFGLGNLPRLATV